MKRTIAIILMLLGAGLLIYWLVDGGRIYGVEKVQVETVDPLFNTTSTEWVEEHHVGLLPYLAPVVGVLFVAAVGLLWSGRRASKG